MVLENIKVCRLYVLTSMWKNLMTLHDLAVRFSRKHLATVSVLWVSTVLLCSANKQATVFTSNALLFNLSCPKMSMMQLEGKHLKR